MKIQTKMIALTLGVFTGLFALLSGLMFLQVSQEMGKLSQKNQILHVQAQGDAVSQWVSGYKEILAQYTRTPEFTTGNWGLMEKAVLETRGGLDDQITSLFLSNLDGDAITDTGASIKIYDQDYFKKIVEGGEPSVVSPGLVSRAEGAKTIVIAQALQVGDKTIGLLGAVILLETLSKIVDETASVIDETSFILDQNALVIGHGNKDLVMNQKITESERRGREGVPAPGEQVLPEKVFSLTYTDGQGIKMSGFSIEIPGTQGWKCVSAFRPDHLKKLLVPLGLLTICTYALFLIPLIWLTRKALANLTGTLMKFSETLIQWEKSITSLAEVEVKKTDSGSLQISTEAKFQNLIHSMQTLGKSLAPYPGNFEERKESAESELLGRGGELTREKGEHSFNRIFFLGIVLLGLITLGAVVCFQAQGLLGKLNQDGVTHMVEARAFELKLWVEGQLKTLKTLGNQTIFKTGSDRDVWTYLAQTDGRSLSEQGELLFANVKGEAFTQKGVEQDISNRDFFREIIENTHFNDLSLEIVLPKAGSKTFTLGVPVTGYFGTLRGVVSASLPVDPLLGLLEKIQLSTQGQAVIFDSTGKELISIHMDETKVNHTSEVSNLELQTEYQEIKKLGEKYGDFITSKGESVRGFFAAVPGHSGWVLGLLLPKEDFFPGQWTLWATLGVLLVVTFFLNILVFSSMEMWWERPLLVLKLRLQKIGQGRLSAPWMLEEKDLFLRKDEFGRLYRRLKSSLETVGSMAREGLLGPFGFFISEESFRRRDIGEGRSVPLQPSPALDDENFEDW